jgi:hypothetical protein
MIMGYQTGQRFLHRYRPDGARHILGIVPWFRPIYDLNRHTHSDHYLSSLLHIGVVRSPQAWRTIKRPSSAAASCHVARGQFIDQGNPLMAEPGTTPRSSPSLQPSFTKNERQHALACVRGKNRQMI